MNVKPGDVVATRARPHDRHEVLDVRSRDSVLVRGPDGEPRYVKASWVVPLRRRRNGQEDADVGGVPG